MRTLRTQYISNVIFCILTATRDSNFNLKMKLGLNRDKIFIAVKK